MSIALLIYVKFFFPFPSYDTISEFMASRRRNCNTFFSTFINSLCTTGHLSFPLDINRCRILATATKGRSTSKLNLPNQIGLSQLHRPVLGQPRMRRTRKRFSIADQKLSRPWSLRASIERRNQRRSK